MEPYKAEYGFSSWKEVQEQYQMEEKEPEEVIVAVYETGAYDGSSVVIYRNGEKYFYNTASHCSCNGLEDQWSPEEFENKTLFLAFLEKLKPYTAKAEIEQAIEYLRK